MIGLLGLVSRNQVSMDQPYTALQYSINNVKNLQENLKSYNQFKSIYSVLLDEFRDAIKLSSLEKSMTPSQRNRFKKIHFLERFDLVIKPITLRVKDLKRFYSIKTRKWKQIEEEYGSLSCFNIISYLFEYNSYFNLAPVFFPDSGKTPNFQLKSDDDDILTNVQIGGYGPILMSNFTNDLFSDDWICRLAFQIYNSDTFSFPTNYKMHFESLEFAIRCHYSYNKADLTRLMTEQILRPVVNTMSNMGYSLTIEESFDLKKELSSKSKLADIPDIQFSLKSDICLTYHKPISKVDVAALNIVICEPSCLQRYIKEFKDDKGRYSNKSNNLKNLFTQGFCQSIFSLNNHGIITDYNTFLLYKIDKDVKMENKNSITSSKALKTSIKVATNGFHCEVINISEGLCLSKLALFISDNVRNVVDNSEECLIRQLKEFMVDLD